MRFPPIDAILAALPHAFLSVGSRQAWCDHHKIDCEPIKKWMYKRGGAPKYPAMCILIEAIEASGVRFEDGRFFVTPKAPSD